MRCLIIIFVFFNNFLKVDIYIYQLTTPQFLQIKYSKQQNNYKIIQIKIICSY